MGNFFILDRPAHTLDAFRLSNLFVVSKAKPAAFTEFEAASVFANAVAAFKALASSFLVSLGASIANVASMACPTAFLTTLSSYARFPSTGVSRPFKFGRNITSLVKPFLYSGTGPAKCAATACSACALVLTLASSCSDAASPRTAVTSPESSLSRVSSPLPPVLCACTTGATTPVPGSTLPATKMNTTPAILIITDNVDQNGF
mmetsp:Transcript_46280/g.100592  ORF Transcript_46280/g.100592 Transcript_46280/m.100592 type:complete len:204 (+) Transcript_46280:241-852(+)